LNKDEDPIWEIPTSLDDDVSIDEILDQIIKDYEAENNIATSKSFLRIEKSIDGRVVISALTPKKN